MKEKVIIVRYCEIHLKGKNRGYFEQVFMNNLEKALAGIRHEIRRPSGRYVVENFDAERADEICERIRKVFGVHTLSVGVKVEADLEAIFAQILEISPDEGTFKIETNRADKHFPLDSMEINRELGGRLLGKKPQLQVDVKTPQTVLHVDIRENGTALVFEGIVKGAGGMPVGTAGKGMLLLSGGIDSPVAGYMIAKRGMRLEGLHFHSYPYTPMESLDKVRRLAAILNRHQKPGTLYACNFSEIQKKIRDVCNPKFRTVLYRRYMMRIANMICRRKRLYAIVTGESVGQVASQTVINLGTIDNAAEYVVLRPLCGLDKMETIRRAEELGTFQTSIEDFPDSCTVFAPPSPSVAAKLYRIEAEEALLGDMTELLERAYETLEITVDR